MPRLGDGTGRELGSIPTKDGLRFREDAPEASPSGTGPGKGKGVEVEGRMKPLSGAKK